MKIFRTITLLVLLLGLFAVPGDALAAPAIAPLKEDVVIFGQEYTLAAGEVINGSLIAFGCEITIEAGAIIRGDLVAFGSDIVMDGTVERSLVAIGSQLEIGETALVEGDLVGPGTDWQRAPGAQINGDTITNELRVDLPEYNIDPTLDFQEFTPAIPDRHWVEDGVRQGMSSVLWMMFQAFAISTLALLVVLFWPKATRRMADTLVDEPLASGGFGLLGLIILPIVILFSVITLVGPFILALAAGIALLFGWIAVGLEVGRRLTEAFKVDWEPSIQAWLGTFALGLVVGILGFVDCIGFIAGMLVAALGFGAVLLTRFGNQAYPPVAEVVVIPPPSPAPESKPGTRKTKKSDSANA